MSVAQKMSLEFRPVGTQYRKCLESMLRLMLAGIVFFPTFKFERTTTKQHLSLTHTCLTTYFCPKNSMSYHFSKIVKEDFEQAVVNVTEALKAEGFGVLTEIDIQATMKKKLEADIRPYKILGACHAPSAYKALQAEERIGLMLPCNVTVRETAGGEVEVSAVDPVTSMQAIENASLGEVAMEVRERLQRVIAGL